MSSGTLKKTFYIFLGSILLLGLVALVFYLNRENLYPKVEEVKYLRVELASDTALVRAGLVVQNKAPLPFFIDSVNYTIRNNGEKLGWGGQLVGKRFPPFGDRQLNFRLYLDTEKYREHLAREQAADSLKLDVAMAVYFNLPFMEPQSITINRTITTDIPKAPAFQIDTLLVKSFSPKGGYAFLLQLNTGNTNLPKLQIADLQYEILFADGTFIDGKIDSTFKLKKGQHTVQVPLKLATAEMVALIGKKLSSKQKWTYQAKASALVKSAHPLFESLEVTVTKSGMLDAGALGGSGNLALPTVKRIKSLEIVRKENQTFLKAALLIHNPTPLPLYIDSARYTVRHQGKLIAQGGRDSEKTFPKNGTQELVLQLAMNNDRYRDMMARVQGQDKIPLEIKLDLIYDLKNSKPQRITIKEMIRVPVPESGGIEVAGLKVKELDPEKGAQLLLLLKVRNNKLAGLKVENLDYDLQLGQDLQLSGRTTQPIEIEKGVSEVEIPLALSAEGVNLLVKRMLQGNLDWNYQFSGSAVVSSENGMLQNTKIALQAAGELDTGNGGGSGKKLMPAITRIDSLAVTVHYDTAWVKLHVEVHNPLPVAINVQGLSLSISHEQDLIANMRENETHVLPARGKKNAWLTLSVNYDAWTDHINHHQHQDSMKLEIPLVLHFAIGNLPAQQVPLSLDTQIPMPYSPVTILQKSVFAGFNRAGIKFNGKVLVQNANVQNLELKGIQYDITLENGVDMCGTINRTYQIPLDQSNLDFPFSLSVLEALKMGTRMLFGPAKLHYKINAVSTISTKSPLLKQVHLKFENHNVSDLQQPKEPSPRLKKKMPPAVVAN